MLTPQQANALRFISDRIAATGIAPTYREIAKGIGLSSKSGINRLVVGLEDRGYIRRLPFRAHAIEVIQPPRETLQALHAQLSTERLERIHLSEALRAKDAAMGVMFERATAAGLDWSDLIS